MEEPKVGKVCHYGLHFQDEEIEVFKKARELAGFRGLKALILNLLRAYIKRYGK